MPITGLPENTLDGKPSARIQDRCRNPSLSLRPNHSWERRLEIWSDMWRHYMRRAGLLAGGQAPLRHQPERLRFPRTAECRSASVGQATRDQPRSLPWLRICRGLWLRLQESCRIRPAKTGWNRWDHPSASKPPARHSCNSQANQGWLAPLFAEAVGLLPNPLVGQCHAHPRAPVVPGIGGFCTVRLVLPLVLLVPGACRATTAGKFIPGEDRARCAGTQPWVPILTRTDSGCARWRRHATTPVGSSFR